MQRNRVFLRGGESYWYIAALICVIGSSLFVQYFFSLTARLLLKADRHVTFLSLTQSLLILLNLLLVVASVRLFDDLLIVKAVSALVFFLQPLIYGIFIKRKYKLDKTVPPDTDSLRQRWSGFGQNLAFFIHTNTDIVILTLFMPLSAVSVYTVYFAVANSLKTLVAALSSAVIPSIGNIAAQDDKERTAGAFDLYEFAVSFITFVLFTCAILLIVPFVGVYTRGITDADYIQPVFGVLILVAEMLYCLRDPYVSIAYTAGHFRQTAPYAYAEAAINIVLSLLLVPRFGLIGVAAGTAVSMAVRMILQVLYTKNRIIMRPVSKCVSRLVVFGVASGASILLFKYVFPAAVNNPIVAIMLPGRIHEVKSRADLKKLRGAMSTHEHLSDFVAQELKQYNVKKFEKSLDMYERLFAGQIDYIIGSRYFSMIEAMKLGIYNKVSFSKQAIWNMPLFIGISKTSFHKKFLSRTFAALMEDPRTTKRIEQILIDTIKKIEKETEGVVPPTFSSDKKLSDIDDVTVDEQPNTMIMILAPGQRKSR